MPNKKTRKVLVDTSFLISLYDESRKNHSVAKRYFKYFLNNSILIFLSTIVVSEFQQKQPVTDLISSGNYLMLPFNFLDAVKAAEISFNLGGLSRRGSQAKYKDDIKLMGQAEHGDFNFIITEDESTLARYCKNLKKAGMFKPVIITLSKGFDGSIFTDGQTTLLKE